MSVDGLDLSRDRIFVASPQGGAHPADGIATRPRRNDDRPSPGPSFPQVGSEFVGFRLIGELGRGTFGRVYLGRQGELAGRLVALKVSTEVLAESQKLARLQHSHIVPIHSLHREGPLQAVCMPYFGSTTLADVLRDLGRLDGLPASGKGLVNTLEDRKSRTRATLDQSDPARGSRSAASGPVPGDFSPLPGEIRRDLLDAPPTLRHLEGLTYVEAVLWMGACLADGLQHAHERGIIHRDLKPANVLLADDGRPMLLDFNLADDLEARHDDADRSAGGTLPYMSPEHLSAFLGLPSPVPGSGVGPDDRPRVDARSDIYSLGVILSELLMGKHPFTRLPGSAEAVIPPMIGERLGAPPAIRAGNLLVSPAVESILHKCLEADPARRYQTARDLHDDLQRQLLHEPLLHAREPSWGERIRKWGRRHPRLSSSTTVIAVAAVLLVSLVLALVSRSRRLDRLESQTRLLAFGELSRPAELFLSSRLEDHQQRLEGREMGLKALAIYDVLDRDDWRDDRRVKSLDESSRRRLTQEMGEVLLLMGYEAKPDEGLVLSDRAVACYADNAPRSLWNQRADLLDRLGRSDQATDARRRAAEAKVAGGAGDHFLEGTDLIRNGDYARAVVELTEAVALEPDHIAARYALGNCCLDGFQEAHGRTLEAVGHYTVCIGLRPRVALPWYGRGLAELRLHRYAAAEADFGRALRLRPEFTQALVSRAIALDRQ